MSTNHSTYDIIILFRLYAQSINTSQSIHVIYYFPLFSRPLFRVFSRQKIHFKPSIYRAGSLYGIPYIVNISRYDTIYCSVLFCFVSFSASTILHIVYIVMIISICCVNIAFLFVVFCCWQFVTVWYHGIL